MKKKVPIDNIWVNPHQVTILHRSLCSDGAELLMGLARDIHIFLHLSSSIFTINWFIQVDLPTRSPWESNLRSLKNLIFWLTRSSMNLILTKQRMIYSPPCCSVPSLLVIFEIIAILLTLKRNCQKPMQ